MSVPHPPPPTPLPPSPPQPPPPSNTLGAGQPCHLRRHHSPVALAPAAPLAPSHLLPMCRPGHLRHPPHLVRREHHTRRKRTSRPHLPLGRGPHHLRHLLLVQLQHRHLTLAAHQLEVSRAPTAQQRQCLWGMGRRGRASQGMAGRVPAQQQLLGDPGPPIRPSRDSAGSEKQGARIGTAGQAKSAS